MTRRAVLVAIAIVATVVVLLAAVVFSSPPTEGSRVIDRFVAELAILHPAVICADHTSTRWPGGELYAGALIEVDAVVSLEVTVTNAMSRGGLTPDDSITGGFGFKNAANVAGTVWIGTSGDLTGTACANKRPPDTLPPDRTVVSILADEPA